jgi:hypothetical protein
MADILHSESVGAGNSDVCWGKSCNDKAVQKFVLHSDMHKLKATIGRRHITLPYVISKTSVRGIVASYVCNNSSV